jgi:predicted nucleic acid-binding protein
MTDLLETDDGAIVSVLTFVEAMSAVARRQRQNRDDRAREQSIALLHRLGRGWLEFEVDADVLQLATAIVASSARAALPFVTLDQTLAAAARAEGFTVLP